MCELCFVLTCCFSVLGRRTGGHLVQGRYLSSQPDARFCFACDCTEIAVSRMLVVALFAIEDITRFFRTLYGFQLNHFVMVEAWNMAEGETEDCCADVLKILYHIIIT